MNTASRTGDTTIRTPRLRRVVMQRGLSLSYGQRQAIHSHDGDRIAFGDRLLCPGCPDFAVCRYPADPARLDWRQRASGFAYHAGGAGDWHAALRRNAQTDEYNRDAGDGNDD